MSELVTSAVTFIFGAFATRWWSRARPLVVLEGFTSISDAATTFPISKELSTLTQTSWFVQTLHEGNESATAIVRTAARAELKLTDYETLLAEYDSILGAFYNAHNDEQIIEAIRFAITKPSLDSAISVCLKSSKISVPIKTYQGDPSLTIVDTEEEDGAYKIVFPSSAWNFSQNLAKKSYLKPRLDPIVQAMRYCDKNTLIDLLKNLKPEIEAQTRILRKAIDLLKPLSEGAGRWAARITVVNYGETALILHPDAFVHISHRTSKGKFRLHCYLAVENAEKSKVHDVRGVHVLAAGEKAVMWVITKEIQQNIPNGALLRTHYNAKDATARVHIRLAGRTTACLVPARSTMSQFADLVSFPD